jgi:CDP-glycerol glycerophosphotransferase
VTQHPESETAVRTEPIVTVIIGAYNAMPYVTRTVQSVLDQSLGLDNIELVAVNDGSTDGTGAELDRFAATWPGMRVIHQPNSGSPSAPRNVGLDLARGRFVFILDADDYLGPEALGRMVAMAEENGTDVVVGKMVGLGGRRAPASMFGRDLPRTDVFSSRVYWTLNPMKLIRRSLIERLGLRFRTTLPATEDQPFVAAAYLAADGISVLDSYDCIYWVYREDEQNVTKRFSDVTSRIAGPEYMLEMLSEALEPGSGRNHLMRRHFENGITGAVLGALFEEPDRAVAAHAFARMRAMVVKHYNDDLQRRLTPWRRVAIHLIEHATLDELLAFYATVLEKEPPALHVEDDRVFVLLPYFRDPALSIPDSCYEVTDRVKLRQHFTALTWRDGVLSVEGSAHIAWLPAADTTVSLVIRRRDGDIEYSLPIRRVGAIADGAFDPHTFLCDIDVATLADGDPLPTGLWDLFVIVEGAGIAKRARFGSRRVGTPDTTARMHAVHGVSSAVLVTPYFTNPYRNLTLDVGCIKHEVDERIGEPTAAWADGDRPAPRVTGSLEITGVAPDAVSLVLSPAAGGAHTQSTYRIPATLTESGGFTTYVADVRPSSAADGLAMPDGRWSISVEFAEGGISRTISVPGFEDRARRWWRGLRPSHIKPRVAEDGGLHVVVSPVDPVRALKRRLAPRPRSQR